MAFTERTGIKPTEQGLKVESQQTGGEELLSPEERSALQLQTASRAAVEDWNDPVVEQFFAEGENLPAEKNLYTEDKSEKAQTTLERYFQKAWDYFKQYVDPPIEDSAIVGERERVREERRFLFATVDQVFDAKTETAAQQALLGHTVTVKGEMYRLDQFVGQGSFGVVYEASTPAGKVVIVKLSHSFTRDLLNKPMPSGASTDTILETAQARNAVGESACLNRLSKDPAASAYFPHFYGAQLAPNPDRKPGEPDRRIAIQVVEAIEGVDLLTMLNREKNLTQYPDYTLQLAQQLTVAVQRMHEANVLHLDLKPGNIIITNDDNPKIIDFGAGQLPDKQRTTERGTSRQWAKALTGNFSSGYVTQSEQAIASQSRDTYALGRVFQNLLYGRFTEATRNNVKAFVAARQPHYDALPVNFKSLSVLADRMAAENPWERLTLAEAKQILHDLVTPTKTEVEDDEEDYIVVDDLANVG